MKSMICMALGGIAAITSAQASQPHAEASRTGESRSHVDAASSAANPRCTNAIFCAVTTSRAPSNGH